MGKCVSYCLDARIDHAGIRVYVHVSITCHPDSRDSFLRGLFVIKNILYAMTSP